MASIALRQLQQLPSGPLLARPVGDLCVMYGTHGWTVRTCGQSETLPFATREQADDFAYAICLIRSQSNARPPQLHHPECCPCYTDRVQH
jgi:hypothetical protein